MKIVKYLKQKKSNINVEDSYEKKYI